MIVGRFWRSSRGEKEGTRDIPSLCNKHASLHAIDHSSRDFEIVQWWKIALKSQKHTTICFGNLSTSTSVKPYVICCHKELDTILMCVLVIDCFIATSCVLLACFA